MAQKFLTDIEVTRGLVDSSGDLGVAGQVLSSTGSGTNWITNEANSTVVYLDEFTGDNSTVDFTISVSVTDENITQVYIDGVYQNKDTYSVSGTTLTFSTAPPLNADIEVITFSTATTSDDLAAGSVIIPVKNTHTASIAKGEPVYITGNVGSSARLQIAPADASNSAKMPAAGLLLQTLAVNAEGYVITGGYLRNITTDTIDGTSTTSNDTVYVKSGGGLTMTKPTGTNLIQNIAKVARSSGGNSGSLLVSSILRTNDVPNITNDYFWLGNSSGVATPTEFTSTARGLLSVGAEGTAAGDGNLAYNNSSGVFTYTPPVLGGLSGTTDDITEGSTNLYYTDARSRNAISVSGNAISYNSSTGVITSNYEENPTFTGNVTISGNLTVDGTQTILNTQTVEVEDNILQLNTTQGSPDTATATTSGISVYRGDGVTQASFIFDDADDTWDLTNNLVVDGNATINGFFTSQGIDDNANATAITINGNEEVGIGTLTPFYKLDVNGTFRASGNATFAGTISGTGINLSNYAQVQVDDAEIYWTNAANNDYWRWRRDASNNFILDHYNGSSTTSALTFNSSQNATFTGSGTFTSDSTSARVLYLEAGSSNGNIIQFQRSSVNKWELVGREGTFYIYKNDGTGSGYKWQIDTNGNHSISGNATFTTDVRAPIFYDSNNTGYYVDPTSTSNLSALNVGGSAVWTSGNDGSGSGLDADLLDGVQGSGYYRHYETTAISSYDSLTAGAWSTNSTSATNIPYANYNATWHISDTGSDRQYQIWMGDTSAGGLRFRAKQGPSTGWHSWEKVWTDVNDGSGSGLDADTLDGIDSASFVRSDADDSLSGQYTFTKTNDHAIKVGTIRGTAVGSQSGDFIQMYERVNIGGPSGWGASNTATPGYGLSTYGGTRLAVYTDYTESGGSMRAPIFYDSNDTSRYLDPTASTSLKTSGTLFVQGGHGDARVHINYQHSPTDTGNSGALTAWVSEPGISYHSAGIGGNINESGQYYGRAYNSGYGCYVRFDKSTGNVEHWSTTATAGNSGGQGTRQWYNDASGNAFATTSSRAPIFYDLANTGYYVNADSTSNLYAVSLYTISTISRLQSGGNLNGQNNFAFGSTGTLGSATSNSNNNAAIGFNSQASNSTGDNNFSFGYASLYSLSSGSDNIAIGDACGYNVTSGSNNLLFGVNAGRTGYQTPQSIAGVTTGSNQIHMGNESHTNAYIQISWTVNSDARDKTDITPIDVGLDFVNQLNPVTFRWDKRSDYEDRTPTGENKLEELTLGFLAQEVETVEKSYGYDVATKTNLVVDRDVEQDHFGITYEKMIPILTKAIQELTQEVQTLKDQINGIN